MFGLVKSSQIMSSFAEKNEKGPLPKIGSSYKKMGTPESSQNLFFFYKLSMTSCIWTHKTCLKLSNQVRSCFFKKNCMTSYIWTHKTCLDLSSQVRSCFTAFCKNQLKTVYFNFNPFICCVRIKV